jgi:hypothetical protein
MLFGRSGIRSSLSRFGMRAAFNVTIGVMKSALTGQKVLSAWVTYPAAPAADGRGEESAEYAGDECFYGQSHRCSAEDVERQVCSDIDAAQADGRDGH